MKALKEKRVSLRSLFRRSLVILSLLALAFASCGESGGDDGGTTGPGGPTTPPAGPRVVSINILKQPTAESFQGCKPVLTGIQVEVVWDSGKDREILGDKDLDKFYTLPGYCNEASYALPNPSTAPTYNETSDAKKMALGYIGQVVISNDLVIPWVVPASSLQITGNAPGEWFADERPDFTGLDYEVIFEEGWYPFASVSGGSTDKGKYKKVKETMTSSYPFTDISKIKDQNKVSAYIGVPGSNSGVVSSSFGIANYYEVMGIEFAGADKWADYFDDDLGKFWDDAGDPKYVKLTSVQNEFKKSGVKFNVFYKGGKQRTITMEQFIANDSWYRSSGIGGTFSGIGVPTMTGSGGTATGNLIGWASWRVTSLSDNTKIYNYNEDEYTWLVTLEYAPAKYVNGNDAVATLSHVNVDIPIWAWAESIDRARVANTGTTNPLIKGVQSGGSPRGLASDEVKAINAKWQLVAKYERGRDSTTRTMDITAPMIYNGYEYTKGGNLSTGTVFFPNQGDPLFVEQVGGRGTGLVSGEVGRNWPLPIYYRNVPLNDESESPLVDVLGL